MRWSSRTAEGRAWCGLRGDEESEGKAGASSWVWCPTRWAPELRFVDRVSMSGLLSEEWGRTCWREEEEECGSCFSDSPPREGEEEQPEEEDCGEEVEAKVEQETGTESKERFSFEGMEAGGLPGSLGLPDIVPMMAR